MEKSLSQIVEVENNVLRPRSSVFMNNRIVQQGAPIVGGFKMEDGPQFRSVNVINSRNDRSVKTGDWYTSNFDDDYETWYETDIIRKGISSTRWNFT